MAGGTRPGAWSAAQASLPRALHHDFCSIAFGYVRQRDLRWSCRGRCEPAHTVLSPPTATAGTSLPHLPFERGLGGAGQASETTLPFHSHTIPSAIPFPSPVQECWAAHDDMISARSGRKTHFVPAWESRARSSGSLTKQVDRTTRGGRGVRRTTQQSARTPPLTTLVRAASVWSPRAHQPSA